MSALAIHDTASCKRSNVTACYIDNFTIVDPKMVHENIKGCSKMPSVNGLSFKSIEM